MRSALFCLVILTGNAVLAQTADEKREWLLAHLIVDMQAKGIYDSQKYQQVEQKIQAMSDSQIGVLVHYYQEKKAEVREAQQARAMQEAQRELQRQQAYRDRLQREAEFAARVRANEEAILSVGREIVTGNIRAVTAGPFGTSYFGPVVVPSRIVVGHPCVHPHHPPVHLHPVHLHPWPH